MERMLAVQVTATNARGLTFKSVDIVNPLTYNQIEASSRTSVSDSRLNRRRSLGKQSETTSAVPPGMAASLPLKVLNTF